MKLELSFFMIVKVFPCLRKVALFTGSLNFKELMGSKSDQSLDYVFVFEATYLLLEDAKLC